jgi:hypothetical protein
MITVIGLAAVAAVVIVLSLLKLILRLLVWLKRRRAQLPPYIRGLRRATEGAFLLAASIYAAMWFPVFLGQTVFDLAQALWRAPMDHAGVAVFFGIAALSVLWIGTGLRSARGGDRDWMSCIWSALIGFGCLALLWWHCYPAADRSFAALLELAIVKGLIIATAAAGLVRLWLTLPIFGNAMKIVARHIRAQAVVWRSARR